MRASAVRTLIWGPSLAILAVAGTQGCDTEAGTSAAPHAAEAHATEAEIAQAVEGWSLWTRVPGTEGIRPSAAAEGVYFDEFINPIYSDWLAAGAEGDVPEGSVVVRPVYSSADPIDLTAVTIMLLRPGASDETDDWTWARLAPDGTLEISGELGVAACSPCHQPVRENHWMLGFDVTAPR